MCNIYNINEGRRKERMSQTRNRNDPLRLMKEAEISSNPGRYGLVVPGQGKDLPFIEDPHLRLEKWGANSMTNITNVENHLKGLNRPLNRDYLNVHEHTNYIPQTQQKNYKTLDRCITDESRSSCPAFLFRGIDLLRWEEPFLNPQANYERPFNFNIQTRILEKDGVYDAPREHKFAPINWLPLGTNTS